MARGKDGVFVGDVAKERDETSSSKSTSCGGRKFLWRE